MVDAAPAWMSTSLGFHRFYNPRFIHRGSLTDSDRQGERPHDGETLLSSSPAPPHYQPIKKTSTCWMGLLSVGESGQCKWSDSMQAIHLQENKRQIIKKLKRKHTVCWELVWNKKTDTSLSPDWETVTSQNHLKDRNATMIQCTDYFCSSTVKIHCCFKRTLNWFCYYLAVKYCDGHFFTCFWHLTGGGGNMHDTC